MTSALQDLITPLDAGRLLENLRRRTPALFRDADPKRFSQLLDWHALSHLFETGALPAGNLRVTRQNQTVPALLYTDNGKASPAKLAQLLDQGVSLIAVPLDPYVQALGELCEDIRGKLREAVYAGAIVTSGAGGAFDLHFDPQDLLIFHVEGMKRWRVYGPPAIVPIDRKAAPPEPGRDLLLDEVLRAGDILVLPAGAWHRCENGPGRSLHVGIFVEPATGWHAYKALVPRLLAEEIFRVPLTRFANAADAAAHEAAVKARLIELIGQTSLSELLAEYDRFAATQADKD